MIHMEHTINYGDKVIRFTIFRSNRKTLGIVVYHNKTVIVKAPYDKSDNEILERVKKRSRWIVKQLNYFNNLPSADRDFQYVSGETHRYLGNQYRLKIKKGEKKSIKMPKGYFEIVHPDPSNKNDIAFIMKDWYRKNAKRKFTEYLEECFISFKKYGLEFPKLEIKEMKTRWGSCNYNNKIILNPNLVKKSPLCIKYVITHELCHLKYYHHGKEFYKLLSKIMPDWKDRKLKLDYSEN